MSRIFFLSLIFFFAFQSGHSQKKVQFSLGSGLAISHHDLDEFNSWDGSFLGNSQFSSYSYGIHGFATYLPKNHFFLRTGIIHQNTRFNFSVSNVNTMNSFSLPIYAGSRWKFLSLFTGVEMEYAIFSYINRRPALNPRESIIFLQDDSFFDFKTFDFKIPFGIEMNLFQWSSIGLRSTVIATQKVGSKFFNSKHRSTYCFFNIKF